MPLFGVYLLQYVNTGESEYETCHFCCTSVDLQVLQKDVIWPLSIFANLTWFGMENFLEWNS